MIKYCYFWQPLNVITLRYPSLDVSIIKYNKFNIAFKPVPPFHTRRLRQRLKKARGSITKPAQRPFDLTAGRNIRPLENKKLRLHPCSRFKFFSFPCDPAAISARRFLVPLVYFLREFFLHFLPLISLLD